MAKRQETKKKVPAKKPKMSKALRDYIAMEERSKKQDKLISKAMEQVRRDRMSGRRYDSPTKMGKIPKDLKDYIDKKERRRQLRSAIINAA